MREQNLIRETFVGKTFCIVSALPTAAASLNKAASNCFLRSLSVSSSSSCCLPPASMSFSSSAISTARSAASCSMSLSQRIMIKIPSNMHAFTRPDRGVEPQLHIAACVPQGIYTISPPSPSTLQELYTSPRQHQARPASRDVEPLART